MWGLILLVVIAWNLAHELNLKNVFSHFLRILDLINMGSFDYLIDSVICVLLSLHFGIGRLYLVEFHDQLGNEDFKILITCPIDWALEHTWKQLEIARLNDLLDPGKSCSTKNRQIHQEAFLAPEEVELTHSVAEVHQLQSIVEVFRSCCLMSNHEAFITTFQR